MGNHVFLSCGHYRKEVLHVLASKPNSDVQALFFSGNCGHPALHWSELKTALLDSIDYDSVDVVSGCCIVGLETSEHDVHYFNAAGMKQCFHMIANPDLVDQYLKEGYYLMTPGWLGRWRYFIRQWGFDRQTARQFFAESTKGLLLLDTGVDSEARRNLHEFSDFVSRPCEVVTVGLGFLDLLLNNMVLKRQLAGRSRYIDDLIREKQKEISHYAMALDLLKTLTQVRGEDAVIQGIIDIFTLLFSPRSISYHPAAGGISAENRSLIRRENGFLLPILSGGQVIGTLDVEGFQFPDYANHYLNLVSGIENVCGLAIENARHYQELQSISNTDGLTRIANRRRFDEVLAEEWKRMNRQHLPLSLIMCDVDFFKRYNDRYGHQAGDDCLRAVARVLSVSCMRSGDLAARYGGEEFAVILPDTGADGAVHLAEAIRQSVQNLEILHDDSPISRHVSITLGVACLIPSSGVSETTLISAADQALYAGKRDGRNRVVAQGIDILRGPP